MNYRLELADGEEVRPIPFYEDHYLVSNMGRVFSLNYRKTRRCVELAQSELYDKRRASESKYRRAKMWHIARGTPTAIHRVVALAFVPNPLGLPQVNHINGDKGDNRAVNLEWCSAAQNVAHAELHGLAMHNKGEDHHAAILTREQVLAIRAELSETPPYNGQLLDIGTRYGVSKFTVWDIKWRKSWTHV